MGFLRGRCLSPDLQGLTQDHRMPLVDSGISSAPLQYSSRGPSHTHTHTVSPTHSTLSGQHFISHLDPHDRLPAVWLGLKPFPFTHQKDLSNEFSLYTPPKACQHNLWPYRTNLDLSKEAYRLFLTWFMPTPSAALSPVIPRNLDYKDIESVVELVCTPCCILHAVGKVMPVLFNNRLYPNIKYKKEQIAPSEISICCSLSVVKRVFTKGPSSVIQRLPGTISAIVFTPYHDLITRIICSCICLCPYYPNSQVPWVQDCVLLVFVAFWDFLPHSGLSTE